tara:strand:- start:3960 stop:4187 length:228 start_codon:yes stop_codon:yes gene_type:complete
MEIIMNQYSIDDEIVEQGMNNATEEEFCRTASSAYKRIGAVAKEICGENASKLDLKITSLALLHDYFSFLQTKTD